MRQIEIRGRLIQQKTFRFGREAPGQYCALTLAPDISFISRSAKLSSSV
jgi:hypothetical protein